uniref:Copper-transporting ATPase PAA1, chloroplastic isoform X2 n=2 Tax=Elaeis guineensis var. tenera TaxID=51953 RepID=A0A6I9RHD5_ELAGV|nr:copper-transporting ATPase PAA1, chloroplastic isoform X2 [Elaeis guineensis]
MESVSLSRIPLIASSKPLKPSPDYRHLRLPFPLYSSSLKAQCFGSLDSRRSLDLFSISFGGNILRSSPTAPVSSRFASISNSAAFSGSGGGGDGPPGGGGGGGGGDYGSSGGEVVVKSVAEESEEVPVLGPDVIVLHVGGMSCGGCAASVKRILESQPQVSSATVSLETETAYVRPVPEVKVTQDWQQQLGEKLATHLTTCGFKSGLKVGEIQSEG